MRGILNLFSTNCGLRKSENIHLMVEFYRAAKVLQAGFVGHERLSCKLTVAPAQMEAAHVGGDFLKDRFIA